MDCSFPCLVSSNFQLDLNEFTRDAADVLSL